MFVPVWISAASVCVCVCVCVCVSWVGLRLKFFCLCCCGPPNGKVLALPSSSPSSSSSTSITNTHTHTLGVGMICRFRCSATLLPILASFRHRQHFLPLSSTPGRAGEEEEEGGGEGRRREEEKGGGHRGDLGFIIHHTAKLHFVFLRRTGEKKRSWFCSGRRDASRPADNLTYYWINHSLSLCWVIVHSQKAK